MDGYCKTKWHYYRTKWCKTILLLFHGCDHSNNWCPCSFTMRTLGFRRFVSFSWFIKPNGVLVTVTHCNCLQSLLKNEKTCFQNWRHSSDQTVLNSCFSDIQSWRSYVGEPYCQSLSNQFFQTRFEDIHPTKQGIISNSSTSFQIQCVTIDAHDNQFSSLYQINQSAWKIISSSKRISPSNQNVPLQKPDFLKQFHYWRQDSHYFLQTSKSPVFSKNLVNVSFDAIESTFFFSLNFKFSWHIFMTGLLGKWGSKQKRNWPWLTHTG